MQSIIDVPGRYRDDVEMTSIGRFLRKSDLDELPMLFNVLLGTKRLSLTK